MAKNAFVGVNGVAKKVSNLYVGVNGVAKKVLKGYVGDANGKAQQFWPSTPSNAIGMVNGVGSITPGAGTSATVKGMPQIATNAWVYCYKTGTAAYNAYYITYDESEEQLYISGPHGLTASSDTGFSIQGMKGETLVILGTSSSDVYTFTHAGVASSNTAPGVSNTNTSTTYNSDYIGVGSAATSYNDTGSSVTSTVNCNYYDATSFINGSLVTRYTHTNVFTHSYSVGKTSTVNNHIYPHICGNYSLETYAGYHIHNVPAGLRHAFSNGGGKVVDIATNTTKVSATNTQTVENGNVRCRIGSAQLSLDSIAIGMQGAEGSAASGNVPAIYGMDGFLWVPNYNTTKVTRNYRYGGAVFAYADDAYSLVPDGANSYIYKGTTGSKQSLTLPSGDWAYIGGRYMLCLYAKSGAVVYSLYRLSDDGMNLSLANDKYLLRME